MSFHRLLDILEAHAPAAVRGSLYNHGDACWKLIARLTRLTAN